MIHGAWRPRNAASTQQIRSPVPRLTLQAQLVLPPLRVASLRRLRGGPHLRPAAAREEEEHDPRDEEYDPPPQVDVHVRRARVEPRVAVRRDAPAREQQAED